MSLVDKETLPEDHEVQLLPKELVTAEPVSRYLRWALGAGRVIIVLVETLVLVVFFARFKLDQDIVNTKKDIDFRLTQIRLDSQFEQNFLATQAEIARVGQLLDQLFEPEPVLQEVLQNTPSQGLNFRRLEITPSLVRIEGTAQDYLLVSSFQAKMESDEGFSQVGLVSLARAPVSSGQIQGEGGVTESGEIQFTIEAEIASETTDEADLQ